jgi:xanthine/uracil permease
MTTLTAVAAATPERPPSRPDRLLVAGLLAGPLFTAAYLTEGAFRGHGYSSLRHPVSSLALGPQGWAQIATFVVCGLLVVLFSVGLRRTLRLGPGALVVPLLVAVWGVSLVGAGIFLTDPVGGYPTAASPLTWHGRVHDLAFSLPGFAALALAMLTASVAFARRRSGRFARYSALSGVAFAVLFVLATTGFAGVDPWASTAGLWQRLSVSVGWLWLFLLAVNRRRATR